MPLPVLDTEANSVYVPLVTFRWGDSHVARYCRGGNGDVVSGGNVFVNEPSIGWSFDTAPSVGLEDSPFTITMRHDLSPIDTLAIQYRHAPTSVLVEEIAIGHEDDRVELFSGRVSRVKRKPRGVRFMADITLAGVKSKLQGDLGLVAASTCRWPFGDRAGSPCGVPLGPITEAATVDTVWHGGVKNRIKLDFAGDPSLVNQRWVRGYIQCDGLKISIRKSYLDGRFDLREFIPPYWAEQSCIAVPGCGKQLSNCRYWENESRFMAPGFKMPDRNPIYEK